jgi:hypothetical protein
VFACSAEHDASSAMATAGMRVRYFFIFIIYNSPLSSLTGGISPVKGEAKYRRAEGYSSFFILHSSFFILHSSFIILHSSFFIYIISL